MDEPNCEKVHLKSFKTVRSFAFLLSQLLLVRPLTIGEPQSKRTGVMMPAPFTSAWMLSKR